MNNNPIDILIKVQGKCPNCGTILTFNESALLEKDNGIKEDAVMCPNCKKVYSVKLTLQNMTFKDEIKTDFNTITNESYEEIRENTDEYANKVNENKVVPENIASKFKEYYEQGQYEQANNLNKTWINKYPDDANVYYAGIIMALYDNSVPFRDMEIMKDVAEKKQAYNTTLYEWFKKESGNALIKQKKSEKTKTEKIIQNNNLNNQNHYKQHINETYEEDNSLFALLFFKKDKVTNQYRISKTKTISIILFLLIFMSTSLISALSMTYGENIEDLIVIIIGSLILSLFISVPVFIIGCLIAYLFDRNAMNKVARANYQQNNYDYNYQKNQEKNLNNNYTDITGKQDKNLNSTNIPIEKSDTYNNPIINQTVNYPNNYRSNIQNDEKKRKIFIAIAIIVIIAILGGLLL